MEVALRWLWTPLLVACAPGPDSPAGLWALQHEARTFDGCENTGAVLRTQETAADVLDVHDTSAGRFALFNATPVEAEWTDDTLTLSGDRRWSNPNTTGTLIEASFDWEPGALRGELAIETADGCRATLETTGWRR